MNNGSVKRRPYILASTAAAAAVAAPQLHKTPQGVFYFSRRGREHGELTSYNVFDKVLHTQVRHEHTAPVDIVHSFGCQLLLAQVSLSSRKRQVGERYEAYAPLASRSWLIMQLCLRS
jgi:hypothetical protein